MNQVKIVATIGPKTSKQSQLKALYSAGMDVARLNGSHGNLAWHKEVIERIRKTVKEVPILLDLPGRKMRIVNLDQDMLVERMDEIILTSLEPEPGVQKVAVNFANLHQVVHPGEVIWVDDGNLQLSVQRIDGSDVVCQAENSLLLRNGKGVHISNQNYRSSMKSDVDRELILFAAENGVDYVGASFVESASDVEAIRSLINGRGPKIIVKIETQQALDNLAEIINSSDALMIDRGDLSVETRSDNVALLQKRVLEEANLASCPVIVATELLQSMVNSRNPTKAEINDITTSVLDKATALMLSEETAIGNFPIDAVKAMKRVADAASEYIRERAETPTHSNDVAVPHAMGEAIALICRNLEVTKIVAITISGYAARMISSKMPSQPILAVTNDPKAARRFNIMHGTRGIYLDIPFSRTNTQHIPGCLELLWRQGDLLDDDLILVTAVGFPKSGNRMNLIQTHRVADLRDSLEWKR